MREPEHKEKEARLVHVPEYVLGAREPRKALLCSLSICLVEARHYTICRVDVLLTPRRRPDEWFGK